MSDLFSTVAFSKSEFSQTFTALDLINLLKDCGISVPDGNDDIERLNTLLKRGGFYKKLSNLPLPSWVDDLLKRETHLSEETLMRINRIILHIAFPDAVPHKLILDRLTGSFSALILLFRLFQAKRFAFLNVELKTDISRAINAILAIENFEKNRKLYHEKKHEYKVFPKEDIYTLNSLLKKIPINVGVDFHIMDFQSNQETSKTYKETRISDRKKFVKARYENNLPDLRFHLKDQVSSFQKEESVRDVLTYGLFYYIDQLMRGKFPRPRKCICENWYLAKKKNQAYCTLKCKDKYYGKSKEGKEVRRRASKVYRLRKKRENRDVLVDH